MMAVKEKVVFMKIGLTRTTYARSILYISDNQAWSLDNLIEQLLRQHFDEADDVTKALTIQEEVLNYRIAQKRNSNPSQGGPPG